jgi:hypothetical protein
MGPRYLWSALLGIGLSAVGALLLASERGGR